MAGIVTALAGASAAVALSSVPLGLWTASARREIERRHPPIGAFVDVDGARLHYVERGDGPAVVLSHGASTNLRDFVPTLLEPLARSFRVILFDRPGYGYSTRPSGAWPSPVRQATLLRSALGTLGVSRPLLVGHSWSGALVLAYALAFPGEAAGLVAIAPASHPWPGGVSLMRTLAMAPGLGPWLANTVVWPLGRRMVDAGIRGAVHPFVPPSSYRSETAIDLQLRPSQFLADANDVGRLAGFLREQSARYGEIETATCIVTGTDDTVLSPRRHAHALHAALQRSRLVVIDGAGHAPHHSHPERVAHEIESLAREVLRHPRDRREG